MCLLLLAALRWARRSISREETESDPVIDNDLRDKLIQKCLHSPIEAMTPTQSVTIPGEAAKNLHPIQYPEDPSMLAATTVANVQERVDDVLGPRVSKPGHSSGLPSRAQTPFAGASGWDQRRYMGDAARQANVAMARARLPGVQRRNNVLPPQSEALHHPTAIRISTIYEEPAKNAPLGAHSCSSSGEPRA